MGRRTVVLIVALVLAALAAFAIWRFLDTVEEDAREGLDEVPAYIAAEFIPRGSSGDEVIDLFVLSEVIEEDLPDNAIQTADDLRSALEGRVSLGPISANAVVTTDMWGDPAEEVQRLSELIDPGFQALSIQPDVVRAVGGLLRPGDRVNLIASGTVNLSAVVEALKSPAARSLFFPDLQLLLALTDEEMVSLAESLPTSVDYTQIFLQDIEVLAVGREAEGGPPTTIAEGETQTGLPSVGFEIVTLQVTAEQAEQVVFSQEFLRTWLSLVPVDYVPEDTLGATIDDIFDLPDNFIDELRRAALLLGTGEGTESTTTTTFPDEPSPEEGATTTTTTLPEESPPEETTTTTTGDQGDG